MPHRGATGCTTRNKAALILSVGSDFLYLRLSPLNRFPMKSKWIVPNFYCQDKIRLLLLIFLVAGFAFNTYGQSEIYFANKTECQLNIKVFYCGGIQGEITIAPNDVYSEISQIQLLTCEVYFPGSPVADFIVHFPTCEQLDSATGSIPCGTGNHQRLTSSNGDVKLSVW